MSDLLLAGDTGGTKTVLGVYAADSGLAAGLAEETFENRRFSGLEEIVSEFLARVGMPVRWASFSVAGPVVNGRSILSNLMWRLDESQLRDTWGLDSVYLLNDLKATALAIAHLAPEQIQTLQPGAPDPHGPRGVIAPGTGLGEGYLLWDGDGYEAHASEGGNADFAPADDLQLELLGYLQRAFGHVSYEQVCSGLGIPNIYAFLKETGVEPEPDWLAADIAAAVDPTPVIVEAALRGSRPPICVRTVLTFAEILAAESGNLALRVLASGGVFIGGGIPPRLLPVLQSPEFVAAFRRKGRYSGLMTDFPLHVILEPRAALIGAAHYGFRRLRASAARPATHVPA